MSDDFRPLIGKAAEGPLSANDAEKAFSLMMEGKAEPAQIGGFLMALRVRGETVEEIAVAAQIMRQKALSVQAPPGAIDIVGTGGDGKKTLNISTTTALVVAASGVPVAKHGNKAVSSSSGAADILLELGVQTMVGPHIVERALEQANIGFMMAPMHHSAMKHVAPSRASLGTRTIFNILGPLTNPAGVKRQLTGVFTPTLMRPMALVLHALGSERAWIVHGGDGSDELAISAPSQIVELAEDGSLHEFEVSPEDIGLSLGNQRDIAGGKPKENAERLRALLNGKCDAYRDAVLLNAAASLLIAGVEPDLLAGVERAAQAIDSGAAKETLAKLVAATNTDA